MRRLFGNLIEDWMFPDAIIDRTCGPLKRLEQCIYRGGQLVVQSGFELCMYRPAVQSQKAVTD